MGRSIAAPGRPLGWAATAALAVAVLLFPLWLFADALGTYRLHSDDFAYIGASRSLARTIENLFVAHNTHIVPAWRMLTWGLMEVAGRLERLQGTLAVASYLALVLAMLAAGHLAAWESGSLAMGLGAMAAVGGTSVLYRAATWYSAGQTIWAGFGVLATLVMLQDWRRLGGRWRLAAGAACAWFAGGMWTVGHVAGPVGAMYLWAAGTRQSRRAAIVPMTATLLAIALALALGARHINAKISFHGRTSGQAIDLGAGVSHTLQAIPESLVIGNLGLKVETEPIQGTLLSLLLAGTWYASRARTGPGTIRRRRMLAAVGAAVAAGLIATLARGQSPHPQAFLYWGVFGLVGSIVLQPAARPLERAGMAMMLLSSLIEWTFRGYLPYSSLRDVVPWYHTIPHLGAVLFAVGWMTPGGAAGPATTLGPVSRRQGLGLIVLIAALLVLHLPRAREQVAGSVVPMTAAEEKTFVTPELRYLRGKALAEMYAGWQRRALVRLDCAEREASAAGIGRDAISQTFGRLHIPELPKVYDAVPMLDLPRTGTETNPARIRALLGPYFRPEPRPFIPGFPPDPESEEDG